LRRAALTVTIGIVFAILVFAHLPGLNGPDYWIWHWQRRGDVLRVVLLFALAAIPALVAQYVRSRAMALLLVCASVVALQFAGSGGVARIERIAHDQLQTSYFTVADSIVKTPGIDWLGQYDELLRRAPQHATTKPPGPVAFYIAIIRLAGSARAPLVMAIAISLLSAAAVIATWWMARTLTDDDGVALETATLLTLAPSMTLFFLYLDPIYPLFACAMLATWWTALQRESRSAAAVFGLVLFATTMISYTLLVLGVPLAGMALMRWRRRSTYELAAIALGVVMAMHALFALATGFNPISAFRTALAMQAYQLPLLHRPWPKTIPFDLLDFFLGAAWVPLVPAICWIARRRDVTSWLVVTPFVVAVTGLIQAETARVWIFLLPLLFLPAARELRTWSARQRLAVHATMVMVVIALYMNMVFIG
jgi:hypothetical protein